MNHRQLQRQQRQQQHDDDDGEEQQEQQQHHNLVVSYENSIEKSISKEYSEYKSRRHGGVLK